jgi:hypothetical protein
MTHELGFSGKMSMFVRMTDHLVVTLSGGFQRWEDKPSFEANPYVSQHSIRLYTVSVGANYRLFSDGISPYIAGELEYLSGTNDGTVLLPLPMSSVPTVRTPFSKNISEIGSIAGIGVLIPMGAVFVFDLAGNSRMTSRTGALLYLGFTIGLRARL